MNISILKNQISVCQLEKDAEILNMEGDFFSITKTDDELSIVCDTKLANELDYKKIENDWRAMKIDGVLDFALVGILAKISTLLADAGISIFAISTYNTDYILLKEEKLEEASFLLERNGYIMK